MGYIEQHLQPDEQIVYKTQLHNIVFLWPTIWLIFGIVSFFSGPSGAVSGMFILLFIAFPFLLSVVIRKRTSEFAITNKRILIKTGWIRRNSLELLNTKVEGIGVEQGILGRIFNFGTIIISGVGTTRQPFKNIENPLEFRTQVNNQISKH
ncbi:MAG: PH domain-containing protein [Candidatus Omnitrophota bacterium]